MLHFCHICITQYIHKSNSNRHPSTPNEGAPPNVYLDALVSNSLAIKRKGKSNINYLD